MRIVKLYEQWVAEEEQASAAQPVAQVAAPAAQPAQATTAAQPATEEVITVVPDGDETKKFTVNGTRKPGSPTGIESSFTVNSSSNVAVKKGATLMISKNPDSEGMFDVVASNDPNNVADSTVWSATVSIG